jgi:hypothetical protein
MFPRAELLPALQVLSPLTSIEAARQARATAPVPNPPAPFTCARATPCEGKRSKEKLMGKGILLWLIGIPIPIILLLWIFGYLH